MKLKNLFFPVFIILTAVPADAACDGNCPFMKNFNDSTLRVDYVFGGGPKGSQILLDDMSKTPGWYGRRHNLDKVPLKGNGSITVTDPATGDTLYYHSFSSLFQEWVLTEEADSANRSFENTFLVPLPKKAADINITLFDNYQKPFVAATHRYSPADELVGTRKVSPLYQEYVHKGADPKEAIDFAIIAEGYRPEERDLFISEAKKMSAEILKYEPFASKKDKLNFIAVMTPSRESGVSVPLENIWVDTAFGSHYSTFHSARYLTAPKVHAMHDALNGIPYEHIITLVNTERYGGGGIFNSYLMSSTRHEHSLPVVVHEFGHSFGGLADEYFYTNEENETYPVGVEPWEPNVTTLVDFDSKWKSMVDPKTPIPTPWQDDKGTREEKMKKAKKNQPKGGPVVGAYEGGGYKEKGVYRPVITCRMRDNYYPTFCPVCEKSIRELIEFYVGK